MLARSAPAAETDARTIREQLFLRNMRSLWRNDPQLALRVDAVHDDERFEVEAAKSGGWTLRLPTPAGGLIYLHSRYDPVAEARKLADSVSLEDKFCFMIAGLGLGYHVKALFDRLKGDVLIVCTEPSIPLIATALSCVDFTELIDSQKLVILTDDDKARLHERLSPFNTLIMLGTQLVRHAPSLQIAERAQSAITHAVSDFVAYTRMTLMTLMANSRRTCVNIAMNLRDYATTPPIDVLRGRFAGFPGVVVSAGPSLRKNLEQLKELKGRAILVAVQTALQPLIQQGVVPDFVTSLDYHEMSAKFFEGVTGLENIHLVAEPKATWRVIEGYPGPVSLLDNAWARLLLDDELAARDGLKAGATVAHLAFYLAQYMGCNPIIFVGQDLAYTGHVYYVPGVEIHRAWRGELNRFNTIEQKEWERIVRNRPILRRVPATTGGELFTDDLLFTYLEQFEKDIAGVSARVINASEGGARIRGAEAMTLREVADRHCRRQIDPGLFAYRSAVAWRDDSRLGPARRELELRSQELRSAVEVCDELIPVLKELEGMTHDPAAFNRRLLRVDELRARVSRESRAYQVINGVTQLAEFRRFSADRRISLKEADETERAKLQLARDLDFIRAVREGAIDTQSILTDALERFCESA